MTIAQRIELRRLGYTKEEVAEMIEEEKNTTSIVVAETEQATKQTEVEQHVNEVHETGDNAAILQAIKDLTSAIQANNVMTKEQPDTVTKPETVADIFNNILGG